jgi:hypothetical protein
MSVNRPTLWFLCCLALLLLSSGCSSENLQRTGYESVESMRRQQCMDAPGADCPAERTRYEDYQEELERLQQEEP